jgi:hypothetical protein
VAATAAAAAAAGKPSPITTKPLLAEGLFFELKEATSLRFPLILAGTRGPGVTRGTIETSFRISRSCSLD